MARQSHACNLSSNSLSALWRALIFNSPSLWRMYRSYWRSEWIRGYYPSRICLVQWGRYCSTKVIAKMVSLFRCPLFCNPSSTHRLSTHVDLDACSISTNEQCSVGSEDRFVVITKVVCVYNVERTSNRQHRTGKCFTCWRGKSTLTYWEPLLLTDRIATIREYWINWRYCLMFETMNVSVLVDCSATLDQSSSRNEGSSWWKLWYEACEGGPTNARQGCR